MALIPASLADSEKALRRLVIVALLYCIPASQPLVPLVDPDIWWHLRTGQWIVDHAQVPAARKRRRAVVPRRDCKVY